MPDGWSGVLMTCLLNSRSADLGWTLYYGPPQSQAMAIIQQVSFVSFLDGRDHGNYSHHWRTTTRGVKQWVHNNQFSNSYWWPVIDRRDWRNPQYATSYFDVSKLSCAVYNYLYYQYNSGVVKSPWLKFVECSLECGYGYIWAEQTLGLYCTVHVDWSLVALVVIMLISCNWTFVQCGHHSQICVNLSLSVSMLTALNHLILST